MKRRSRHSAPAMQIGALVGFCHLLLSALSIPASAQGEGPLKIVALGDSLTAGFLLRPADAFPAQLERALKAKGYTIEIINAGVSGDTVAAGLERLDWAVPQGTDAVILELGANDALRGLDPAATRRNLEAIIKHLTAKKTAVLLAGMRAPRNWGEDYARRFDSIFPELATKYGVILYPFFLEGVALRPDLNLEDRLHPNARGVAEIVRNMLSAVEQLIARIKTNRAAAVQ